jgi:hypothetical protein
MQIVKPNQINILPLAVLRNRDFSAKDFFAKTFREDHGENLHRTRRERATIGSRDQEHEE